MKRKCTHFFKERSLNKLYLERFVDADLASGYNFSATSKLVFKILKKQLIKGIKTTWVDQFWPQLNWIVSVSFSPTLCGCVCVQEWEGIKTLALILASSWWFPRKVFGCLGTSLRHSSYLHKMKIRWYDSWDCFQHNAYKIPCTIPSNEQVLNKYWFYLSSPQR